MPRRCLRAPRPAGVYSTGHSPTLRRPSDRRCWVSGELLGVPVGPCLVNGKQVTGAGESLRLQDRAPLTQQTAGLVRDFVGVSVDGDAAAV